MNREFIQKLDENQFILSFDNGVFDFKNKEFRDKQASDFVSKSCGYNLSL